MLIYDRGLGSLSFVLARNSHGPATVLNGDKKNKISKLGRRATVRVKGEPQDEIKCKVWEAECWQGGYMGLG